MFSFERILTKEFVLARVSQEEIFARYMGEYPRIGERFLNPLPGRLKADQHPDCVYFYSDSGKLLFKDWAFTPGSGCSVWDCFAVVQQYYSCSYQQALEHIIADFNLVDTESNTPVPKVYDQQHTLQHAKPREGYTPIQVRRTCWNAENLSFWQLPGLSSTVSDLEKHRIFPIDSYWMDGWLCATGLRNTYGYQLGLPDKWQIYQPHASKRFKFRQSSSSWVIGLSECRIDSYILVTKSYKDWYVLKRLGYNVCCVLSETIWLTPEQITQVEAFGTPYLLLDNDQPGLEAAYERAVAWDWEFIYYPSEYGKDSFESVKNQGVETVQQHLNSKLQ